ncbi:hypothetical protein T484DRAFT_1778136 [Baffinella frigidus]|nr:hypothetical protein T484DRAFT_1778136 [Cryptophyta sp. CCMP2293]
MAAVGQDTAPALRAWRPLLGEAEEGWESHVAAFALLPVTSRNQGESVHVAALALLPVTSRNQGEVGEEARSAEHQLFLVADEKQIANVGEEARSAEHQLFLVADEKQIANVALETALNSKSRRQYGATLLDSSNVGSVVFSLAHIIHAYLKLHPEADKEVSIAVDAGDYTKASAYARRDYTQASAAYYARRMGLPIRRIFVAAPDAGGAESDIALERLAYEFCGRDPGRVVEAAARKGGVGGTIR